MKLYNVMEESCLKENLIHKWITNIVRQNDGYEFLFDDEVYLPVYKYALKITKRKTIFAGDWIPSICASTNIGCGNTATKINNIEKTIQNIEYSI